ncbi:unnamed protein product [Blepharisma stoltei]|uniref:Uncharacterized protein n=1 Tax=Blepharisma stoltei TaxID=1481888 RepID=A0AAU9K7X6_9CILI|nr:unnamed protein product [Blepharisma stoltei]
MKRPQAPLTKKNHLFNARFEVILTVLGVGGFFFTFWLAKYMQKEKLKNPEFYNQYIFGEDSASNEMAKSGETNN